MSLASCRTYDQHIVSILFLFTCNEQIKIMRMIPFIVVKKNRYLGINLTQELQELYIEIMRFLS